MKLVLPNGATVEGEASEIAEVCGKMYGSVRTVVKHVRVSHKRGKRKVCPNCNKGFLGEEKVVCCSKSCATSYRSKAKKHAKV